MARLPTLLITSVTVPMVIMDKTANMRAKTLVLPMSIFVTGMALVTMKMMETTEQRPSVFVMTSISKQTSVSLKNSQSATLIHAVMEATAQMLLLSLMTTFVTAHQSGRARIAIQHLMYVTDNTAAMEVARLSWVGIISGVSARKDTRVRNVM